MKYSPGLSEASWFNEDSRFQGPLQLKSRTGFPRLSALKRWNIGKRMHSASCSRGILYATISKACSLCSLVKPLSYCLRVPVPRKCSLSPKVCRIYLPSAAALRVRKSKSYPQNTKKTVYSGDLVLLDLAMPYIDGIKVGRQLHAIDPKVPLIAFTGLDPWGLESAARNAGILRVISKSEGWRLVETWLTNSKSRDAKRKLYSIGQVRCRICSIQLAGPLGGQMLQNDVDRPKADGFCWLPL
jgi:CheY-like chemotaxis protein